MRRRLASRMLAPVALAAVLAACAGEPEDTEPAPTPSVTADAPSDPRTLVAADFGELELGPKIEGPVGPEVEASIIVDGRSIGDIVSYVACPAGVEECDPDELPDDTVYTYVHTVRPGVDDPNDPPFMRPCLPRCARRGASTARSALIARRWKRRSARMARSACRTTTVRSPGASWAAMAGRPVRRSPFSGKALCHPQGPTRLILCAPTRRSPWRPGHSLPGRRTTDLSCGASRDGLARGGAGH